MRRGIGHWGAILLMAGFLTRLAFGQAIAFRSEYSLLAAGSTSPAAIAVEAGSVYTAGTVSSRAGAEGFLRKTDAAGNEVWTRRFGDESTVSSVTVGGGGIYVAGSAAARPRDALARKYDPAGNLLWTRKLGAGDDDLGLGVAFAGDGVYVVWDSHSSGAQPQGHVTKFGPDGGELWTRDITPRGIAQFVAADASGAYVSGSFFTGPNESQAFLRKYDPAGSELWTSRIELQSSVPGGVAVDSTGVYVGGKSGQSLFLRKHTPGGGMLWERLAAADGGAAARVAVDEGGVYVLDSVLDTLPGQCGAGLTDLVVRKHDPASGAALWVRQLGTIEEDFQGGLAPGPDGVYIGAVSYSLKGGARGALTRIEKTPRPSDGRPRIQWECVLNAASYEGGAVAPGEIVTILGSGIGPARPEGAVIQQGRLATAVAETRVLFDGVPAPLVYVSEGQTNAIVPYSVAAKATVEVAVEHRGRRSDAVSLPVVPARPGIFTADSSGRGYAAAINQDGTVNSPAKPAERGSVVTLFVTGEGLTDPPGQDGVLLSGATPRPKLPVAVSLGSPFEDAIRGNALFPAEILYAGGVPGLAAGLLQINIRVPQSLATGGRAGDWQLNLSIGDMALAAGIMQESPIRLVAR